VAKKPANKWAFLKVKYPQLPEEPTYDDALAMFREQHRDHTPEQLAALLNAAEDVKAGIEEKLSGVNAEIKALEQILVTQLQERDIEKLVVGGFSFAAKTDFSQKIIDPDTFYAYINKEMPELLSVHSSTLHGVIGRALEDNQQLPPGVQITPFDKLARRTT
jgi:hypothetical protein